MDRYCLPENCHDCPDKIICHCLRVSESAVVQVITRLELRTVKEIRREIGAGDGCTCCHQQLKEYIEKYGCVAAVA